MVYWGSSDKLWLSLSGPQKAAAMALLEADGRNPSDARNALGAMINRAEAEGQSLDQHVSRSIYQPTIEDNQRARLESIVNSPEFAPLADLATARARGTVPDWVNGADHFIAPPKVMLGLEAGNPTKYKDWGPNGSNWTGYDPATGEYSKKVFADNSHHFLKLYGDAPKGSSDGLLASYKPDTPAESEAKSPQTAPEPQGKNMDWLSAIMGAFGGGSGSPGGGALAGLFGGDEAAAPTLGASPTPLPTDGAGGMLSGLFNPKGGGGADSGLALAQNAATMAGGAKAPLGPLSRTPVDMSRLQQLLAQRPMLGMRPQAQG